MRILLALALLSAGCTRAWMAITKPELYGTSLQRKNWAESKRCRSECSWQLHQMPMHDDDDGMLVLATMNAKIINQKWYDRCTCVLPRDPFSTGFYRISGNGEFYIEHRETP